MDKAATEMKSTNVRLKETLVRVKYSDLCVRNVNLLLKHKHTFATPEHASGSVLYAHVVNVCDSKQSRTLVTA